MEPLTMSNRLASLFCRRNAGLLAVAVGIATALLVGESRASVPDTFREIQVQVVGNGKPVLMIPGLNSAGSVWTETCAALQPQVQCHIVQLPGFAGAPASAEAREARFLETMRERLIAYVAEKRLGPVVLMGHSLGGVLAMQMTLATPAAVERVVIVDSLPFLAGIRDPNTSAEAARQMAQGMRQQMRAAPDDQFAAQTRASAFGMTRAAGGTERIAQMGLASDRHTTAQAMSELWGLDLRAELAKIEKPVLVLGAWAAYEQYGSTMASTRAIFERQYAALRGVQIRMSERGYHFLMWDDPSWLVSEVRGFLGPR
jgi:pimeloyl-ACP methyl ester carboxylesterase